MLRALQEKLLRKDFFEELCNEFTKEVNRLRMQQRATLVGARRDLEGVRRGIRKIIEAIKEGVSGAELKAEMAELPSRKEVLLAQLTAADEPPLLHPRMADIYRAKVAELAVALQQRDTRLEASEALRGLIDAIVVSPDGGSRALVEQRALQVAGAVPGADEAAAPAIITRMPDVTAGWPRFTIGVTAVAVVTVLYRTVGVSNTAVVSTTFLLVVLVVAAASRLGTAVGVSIVAVLSFNYFFLPPVGTFTVVDPQNWLALVAFLAVSVVASNLSAVARTRTAEALMRRDEQARLFDLSRDVLVMPDSREALTALAHAVARRFDLEYIAIALPAGDGWDVSPAGTRALTLDVQELTTALAVAQTTLEFDARSRTYSGHRETEIDGRVVRLVPLRVGTRAIGLLAAAGRPVDPGTLDALAGVVAIAIERATLLQERKVAERTRQSEELKSALLASIGHDLRTPLTAIRVAAANLQADALTAAERTDQADLIQAEVERLARLFQNLMDMARLDAGSVAHERRWVHPSEIVAAARDQVAHALGTRHVEVTVDPDVPVRIDPRLTAAALAHVLENAAQYSPVGSPIEMQAGVTGDGLEIVVRDHGPGIAPADLPHLFDRFYRGVAARARTSGTGMGLWIARGFLSAQQGRVWAENASDGGATFTIVVPAGDDTPAPALTQDADT